MSIEDGEVSDLELDEDEDGDEAPSQSETKMDHPPANGFTPGHDCQLPHYQWVEVGQTIKLRDLREYVVLAATVSGIIVGELENDFSKFGNTFFWRNETIADLKKKNRILEVK